MTPDKRELATRLYHAALERPPEGRDAYLQDACGGDESLRLEVKSLLQYEEEAAVFLERAAAETLGYPGQPRLMIGAEFGHYAIVSYIGAGGMGEVYRARDRKLGRDVAIKLLPHHSGSPRYRPLSGARERVEAASDGQR